MLCTATPYRGFKSLRYRHVEGSYFVDIATGRSFLFAYSPFDELLLAGPSSAVVTARHWRQHPICDMHSGIWPTMLSLTMTNAPRGGSLQMTSTWPGSQCLLGGPNNIANPVCCNKCQSRLFRLIRWPPNPVTSQFRAISLAYSRHPRTRIPDWVD